MSVDLDTADPHYVQGGHSIAKTANGQALHDATTEQDDAADPYSSITQAENEEIRHHILQQGVIWPEAIPTLRLDTPGHEACSSTWHLSESSERAWRAALGGAGAKKDMPQSLLALIVLVLLCSNMLPAGKTIVPSKYVSLIPVTWAYTTMLLLFRQGSPLISKSPFTSPFYDHLTLHVIPMLFTSVFALSHHAYFQLGQKTGPDAATILSVVFPSLLTFLILVLEFIMPRQTKFISIDEYRRCTRACNALETDETQQSLLSGCDMNATKILKGRPTYPEVGVSLLSYMSFSYIGSFVFKHARVPITIDAIPDIRPDNKTAFAVLQYREENVKKTKLTSQTTTTATQKPQSILRRFIYYFWPMLLQLIAWSLLQPWFTVLPPFFVNRLLRWTTLRDQGEPVQYGTAVLSILGIFASITARTLISASAITLSARLGIRANAILSAELYTKLLRRKEVLKPPTKNENGEAEEQASAGKAQNVISVDAGRVIDLLASNPLFFPNAILTLTVALTMLFNIIGISALATVAAMIGQYIYQVAAGRISYFYQKEVLSASDARLTLSSEILHGIKTLKFLAWERGFAEALQAKRNAELHALRKQTVIRALISGVTYSGPIIVPLVTFLFHTKILGRPLDAATAFTVMSLFTVIRAPFEEAIGKILGIVSALVSCHRVDEFLREEETDKYSQHNAENPADVNRVGLENATFTWAGNDSVKTDDSSKFRLSDITLDFQTGGLSLIVGSVGSVRNQNNRLSGVCLIAKLSQGKSSLLHALLGEMTLLEGRRFLPSNAVRKTDYDPAQALLADSVAFCTQSPWLQNGTIRENILFGAPFNQARYETVLHACALHPDLAVLQRGDRTLVGEKGTVLSGGQKARISLARAVYSSAKTLLLDDILSAVDSHTAKHIALHCLSARSLEDRTCILVTHATQLMLPLADFVVLLDKGKVAFAGKPMNYVSEHTSSDSTIDKVSSQNEKPSSSGSLSRADGLDKPMESNSQQPTVDPCQPSQEATEETRTNDSTVTLKSGSVKLDVYTFYGKAFASATLWISLLVVITMTEVSAVYTNWFLRLWTGSLMIGDSRTGSSPENPDGRFVQSNYYLAGYVALACAAVILYSGRLLFWFWRGTYASATIYEKVVKSLLNATRSYKIHPLCWRFPDSFCAARYFDVTPVGQIMNRLSRDIDALDQSVPGGLLYSTLELFAIVGVVIAVAIALPRFLLAGVFILAAYVPLGWAFVISARDMKRIESTTRSPYYSLIGETLLGVTTIRAYGDVARFTRRLLSLMDYGNRPSMCLFYTNMWLTVRMQIGGALFATLAAIYIVVDKNVNAALAGFVMTYALILEERVFWMINHWTNSQLYMSSIERLKHEAVELIPQAAILQEPPAYWPSATGSIEVEGLEARYADGLPLALKGISFTVKPGERVGIVGRTGSGKSTLALSFMRFVEAYKGQIVIDGVNIADINLHTLRSRLTIIPQDATLFTGTIRFNLDPFGEHSDAELYDILRRTGLLASVYASSALSAPEPASTSNGGTLKSSTFAIQNLDDQVLQGGKNFSAGQKQLLCLARGLLKLKRSNFLILDESTANLDHNTDLIIQSAIREEIGMRQVTVLCIAHRLQTIIDFDRVLVLSDGKIEEFDTPANLLSRGENGSQFARLCKETGDFARLKGSAEKGIGT